MTISQQESIPLTCGACGQQSMVTAWTLIDAGERPELRAALADGSLNLQPCPSCAQPLQPSGPLLLHDPQARRVYFAVPYDVEEHRWRSQAQELLYALVGALPEEARLPYLGDVQVEWGIDGVQRALTRKARRGAARRQQVSSPQASAEATPAHTPTEQIPELLERVQLLLAVDTTDEFTTMVHEYPELLSSAADTLLASLATEARTATEHEAAAAIEQVRAMLRGMWPHTPQDTPLSHAELDTTAEPEPAILTDALSDAAYQAFLVIATPADLIDAVRDHPALLEPWVEPLLTTRAEAALDIGNERLAAVIGVQAELLTTLRAELTAEPLVRQALRTLVAAKTEDEIAHILAEYPVLLTEFAQSMLAAAAAQASDQARAARFTQCRAMLRRVRSSMDMS